MKEVEMSKLGYGLTYFNRNDEYVCPECRALEDTVFFSEDAPATPYEKCTSEIGKCRCWTSHLYAENTDFDSLKMASPDTREKVLEAERKEEELWDSHYEEQAQAAKKKKALWDRLLGR